MLLNLGCPPISQIWSLIRQNIQIILTFAYFPFTDLEFWINLTSDRNNTLIVTFPLETFLILNPTVGIMSSLKCPDWKQNQKRTFLLKHNYVWVKTSTCLGTLLHISFCMSVEYQLQEQNWGRKESLLGKRKLSYKKDTKSIWKSISSIKVKTLTIHLPYSKNVSSAGHDLLNIWLAESPDEAKWEWVQQSHDWKRRNRYTILSSAMHFFLYSLFFHWK